MSCVKNLVCEAGYLADYRKNACVKIESGYEMNLANSIYIYNVFNMIIKNIIID